MINRIGHLAGKTNGHCLRTVIYIPVGCAIARNPFRVATLPIAADTGIDGTPWPAIITALDGCPFGAFARTIPWSFIFEQSKHGPRQALQQLAVGPGTREHAYPE
jgi:hypothetical protein